MDTINNVGLIFGIGVLLFIFLVIVAVSFIIARFSIKYFASKAIIIATPNYQPSVFARLFLKLNFVVFYLFIFLFGLYALIGFPSFNNRLLLNTEADLIIFFAIGVLAFMPYIKTLYYYQQTGFKFLRVYVMVFFVHYVCWCFMLILPLTEFLGKKVNPNILHLMMQPFTASL